jgi:hypothetical protein
MDLKNSHGYLVCLQQPSGQLVVKSHSVPLVQHPEGYSTNEKGYSIHCSSPGVPLQKPGHGPAERPLSPPRTTWQWGRTSGSKRFENL